MPEDLYQATEPASPFQRRRARRAGRIPRSAEVNAVLVLVAGLAVLTALSPSILNGLSGFLREMLSVSSNDHPLALLRRSAWRFLAIAGPVCVSLAGIALLAGFIQSGFYFSAEPLGLKFERLHLADGLRRVFSLRSVLRFVLNLAKVLVVGLTAFLSVRAVLPDLAGLSSLPPELLLGAIGRLLLSVGLRLILVLSVLAALDYFLVRYLLQRDLRMSHQQLRQEQRDIEGSDLTRQRRSSLALVSPGRLAAAVLQADLVLTDSQTDRSAARLALVLRHRSTGGLSSPVRLLAKGSGALARQICTLAQQRGLPIHNRPALAQALARAVPLNHYVPLRLYPEIAELLEHLHNGAVPAVSA
ncbi:MAG: hypothetical protein GWP14_08910 [Actinobacteria bacterium]|nr:hypothetical protein [Actinomycetota bacterium]